MEANKHYHLIGIGGIGMSAIAALMLRRGIRVSGSDLKESSITGELKALGAQISIGHRAANIADPDAVVYSSAIKKDNPELAEAIKRKLLLLRRAEALAVLMKDKSVIAISGSHGKTTITSLISYMLLKADLNPTAAIGGILRNIETNVSLGDGDFFIAEADESDGSFLCYSPKYSVVTNIDYEHMDYYGSMDRQVEAFRMFLERTDDLGCNFLCLDDPRVRAIAAGTKKRHVSFGLCEGSDVTARNIRLNGLSSEFDCYHSKELIGHYVLSLGGTHNVSNALSVIAVGRELGIGSDVIKDALSGYKGACRRIEVKFQDENYSIIDDYAHHPTEIKATLAAVRNLNAGRVIAVFQPHRYSRAKVLADEFAKSFDLADYVVVTDIYPAGEMPIDGISGKYIHDKIKEFNPNKDLSFLSKDKIVDHIRQLIRPHDLVITLGAGDIIRTCEELVEKIRDKAQKA